jgi:hypothetical protein
MEQLVLLGTRVAHSVWWLGYRLDNQGSNLSRDMEGISCFHHGIQTGPGVHTAFHSVDTKVFPQE